MNITNHIVTGANWDAGRAGNKVTGIVLHTMVGTVAGSQARFNNPNSQVSVHYGVGLNGSITRWVNEKDTAWQAGNYSVNLRTIGIEHEDNGNYNDSRRTAALYEASSSLVADICRRYGLPADKNHIFLHKNVIDKSRYPGGTACPDGLDTNKIIAMAANKLKGGSVYKATLGGKTLDFGTKEAYILAKTYRNNWQIELKHVAEVQKQLKAETANKVIWRKRYIDYLRNASDALKSIPDHIKNQVK